MAASLSVVVLSATLLGLDELRVTTRINGLQNDAQQEARRSLSLIARELRNLASPTDEHPAAVEVADTGHVIFLTVGGDKPAGSENALNTRRVRYCLDTAERTVWRQEQTWTTAAAPALPSTAACPEPETTGGWGAGRVAAHDVVNGSRAVFAYNAAALDSITEIRATLFVDVNPGERPRETELETGVFLRNQNRRPTASFTATVSGSDIVLNGSASTDPEGRALKYEWLDGGVKVGTGIVNTYTPVQAGNHTMSLRVLDPAELSDTAPEQVVCVVGEASPC